MIRFERTLSDAEISALIDGVTGHPLAVRGALAEAGLIGPGGEPTRLGQVVRMREFDALLDREFGPVRPLRAALSAQKASVVVGGRVRA